jgi:hypothetical protein
MFELPELLVWAGIAGLLAFLVGVLAWQLGMLVDPKRPRTKRPPLKTKWAKPK